MTFDHQSMYNESSELTHNPEKHSYDRQQCSREYLEFGKMTPQFRIERVLECGIAFNRSDSDAWMLSSINSL
jgi:hypothetical protein